MSRKVDKIRWWLRMIAPVVFWYCVLEGPHGTQAQYSSVVEVQPSATVEPLLIPFETSELFNTPSPTPLPAIITSSAAMFPDVSTSISVPLPTPQVDVSSGSGDLEFVLCNHANIQLDVSQYDFIVERFEEFDCHSSGLDDSVVYLILTSEGTTDVVNSSTVFSDYFTPGAYTPEITVCSGEQLDVCNDTALRHVQLDVMPTADRLFPFGFNYGDSYIADVDDRAVSLSIPRGIPFLTRYYPSLYLSTNGLVSFGAPYLSWWAVPFPYGFRQVPVIAPYWADLDFRNSIPGSALYHQVYTSSDAEGSLRTRSLLNEFSQRLQGYGASTVNFDPEWMAVVTWNQVSPYYGGHNMDETVTFQLILATDYINTYAFFLYQDGGFNWDIERRQWQRIVVGYDANDYIIFKNVYSPADSNINDVLQIDTVLGNSNLPGVWYFNFTPSATNRNHEQLCFEWAKRQPGNLSETQFEGLPSCPCTHSQALRDWRFWFLHRWGLSSRENCATFLFSRTRRQSAIECCYDNKGSLLVGPPSGGSYKLYNPLFYPRDHTIEDVSPYDNCCAFADLCSTYYEHRPSDDCSSYSPPMPRFLWGDPHFRSVDGNNFTFNGIGEYLLLRSRGNEFDIQARFVPFDNTVNATVTSTLAIRQGRSQTVQIGSTEEGLQLYINGTSYELPNMESVIVVSETHVFTDLGSFSNDSSAFVSGYISIRNDSGTLILSASSEASVMVSTQTSFIRTIIELPESFMDDTRGLLGYFNGRPEDDFRLPNDTTLPHNLTEEQVYYDFGLHWHLGEAESLFNYPGGSSYETYNQGYDTFTPTFTQVQAGPPECHGDFSCIYDSQVTGRMDIGLSSLNASVENQETETILDNRPPNITGRLIVRVDVNVSLEEMYQAEDQEGDDIHTFTLQDPTPADIELQNPMGQINSALLRWPNPGYELPSTAIQLFVNDSSGASTTRNVSIVLCACQNNGQCGVVVEPPQFNHDGHYKVPCECPEFFIGDSCQNDTRGCVPDPCPVYAACTVNDTVPERYMCTDCQEGYHVNVSQKCVDVDECATDQTNNCSQICVNSDGSYECDCRVGYRLSGDGQTCEDVDECVEGADNCEQLCINTGGSYECSCLPPYSLDPNNASCSTAPCSGGECDTGLCATFGGISVCYCPVGERCDGECSGNPTFLRSEEQSCVGCPNNTYGFNCSQTCDCVNGYCNRSTGCECEEGWSGTNCNIEVNSYAPEFTADTPTLLMVPKDLPTGAVITTIRATDNDTNPNTRMVSYFLQDPGYELPTGTSNGIGVFRIGRVTGTITLIVPLNTSTNSRFLLTIEAVDNGQLPRSTQHILTVIPSVVNLPVPQFSRTEYTARIPEDTSVNTTVVNVTCMEINLDSDSSEVNVSLLHGSNAAPFVLEGSQLILIQELDFESLPNRDSPVYRLDLLCTNRYNISTMAHVEITITNVDDNPFVFTNDSYSASIPENAMNGYSVLSVNAFDNDEPHGRIRYFIANQVNPFEIDPYSGEISVVNELALDREVQENYVLMVRAELSQTSQNDTEVLVDITLLDVNDNNPIFDDGLYFAPTISTRNMSGDYLVTVNATDNDLGENGTITYHLAANNFLEINESTGDVFINSSSLDFGSFRVNVYAIDGGKPPRIGSSAISILIRPSPERVEFIHGNAIFEFTVQEDRPRGSLIGRVAADIVDENNAVVTPNITGRVRYSVINNTAPFFISETTGEIHLLSTLDFESSRTHLLTIEAALPGDPQVSPASTTVQITVTNVNDNPPVFVPRFYARVLEEFTSANISILSVSATDRDLEAGGSGTITYSLPEDVGEFEVDPDTGSLTARVSLDTPRDYRFNVIASDGEMTAQAVVFISVVRSASVTPTFTRDLYIFNISENIQTGTNIGAVLALTRGSRAIEEYSHLLYRIRMPDIAGLDAGSGDGALFHIDPDSGNISALGVFDAESQVEYVFYVEVYNASDSTHIFDNASVEIRILDENDRPPVFDRSLYTLVVTIAEPVGSVILTVNAIDEDHSTSNRNIGYSLAPNTTFDINSMSGNITVVSPLEVGNYRLTATARDGGSPTQTGTATVFIAVIPATPEAIQFTENEYHFTVREDAPANTLVGIVQALDHLNISQGGIVYSTPNVTECLHIDPIDGEVRVGCSLDREMDARYELLVIANFTQTAELGRVKVVVNVLDINDESPRFTLDIYAKLIREDFGNGSAVVTVEAADRDAGQNGTVEYSFLEDSNGGMLTPSNSTAQTINHTDLFRIDSNSGDIFLVESTVPAGDFKLTVVATDLGIPERRTSTALVLICVTRAPPPPLSFTTTEFSIAENEPVGTVVGTVALQTSSGADINPADYTNNLRFSITGGDTRDLFYIVPGNGTVRTLIGLDREEAHSHVIEVLATFSTFGNLSFNASITILVTDRNDEDPRFLSGQYSVTIDDSYDTATAIQNVSARDIDEGRNAALTFTIASGTPFGINTTSVSGAVTSGMMFVANSSILIPGQYQFTITATDNGTTPRSGTVTVLVVVNHAIPEFISFPPAAYSFSLIEHYPPGTLVGSVSVQQTTPALDNLVYFISGGTGFGYFNCDPSTGRITNSLLVDREMDTQLNLTITARLPGEPTLSSVSTPVTINITDINDNRPLFDPSSYTLSIFTTDITTGQKLLTVFADDRDEGSNQLLEYNISLSEPTPSFRISTNGDIFATSTPLPAAIYRLTVTAWDRGIPRLNGSTIVTITVVEPIPRSIQLTEPEYHLNTSEYTPSGSHIGNVILDPIPQEFQQYVTFHTASINFSIVPSTGEIRTRIRLDYELRQSYSFTVEAYLRIPNEDPPVSLTATATVNVDVIDENDNTPEFMDFPTTISFPENRTTQVEVRTIVANDLDSGTNGMLRYEILNDVSAEFVLGITSGVLSVVASLDREEQEVYTLNVRVADLGNPRRSSESIITFTLLDINDNPPVLTSGLVYRVRERLSTSTFPLTTTDQDLGGYGNVRYSFMSPPGQFTVDENTGIVTVQELDYETGPADHLYSITLQLRDNWNPVNSSSNTNTVEQIITVEITDAPDNPPGFTQSSYSVETDPTVNQDETMVTVSAQDADDDRITYSITGTQVQGNEGNVPSFAIDSITGRIYSTAPQTFGTESVFTITVQARDNSEFTLTSTSQAVITVQPERLDFTQPSYTTSIVENVPTGSTVTTLPIRQLSRSSDIRYSAVVTQPAGQSSVFRAVGEGESQVNIILNSPLDRELVDRYTVQVTATRADRSETATTTLTVDILDYNDNSPVFTDGNGAVVVIPENIPASTSISRANATDADIGSNSELQFSFTPPNLPFSIDPSSGVISTAGVIDYEVTQRFTLTVQVRDLGSPGRSAPPNVYYINVTNENDNYPQFEAGAYFGEVYAGAPDNYRVHHTIIRVSDADDPQNQQQISFQISIPTGTGITGYNLQVADREPYYVVAVSIPDSARSQLLEFRIRVTDEGGLDSEVPLYLSIFTSENVIGFVLDGVRLQDFLSCEDPRTSGCEFRNSVADFVGDLSSVQNFVSFYNDSVRVSADDIQKLTVMLYGWYGSNGFRDNDGVLTTSSRPPEVAYITFDTQLLESVTAAIATTREFNTFDFGVTTEEMTVPPPTATPGAPFSEVTIGVISGVVLAALLIVLVIVLVCVFGRRRRDDPRPKRQRRDPYDRDLSRSRGRGARGVAKGRSRDPRRNKSEEMALTRSAAGSDLAYETMYDDDEIMNTQTMPWFDPKYLAGTIPQREEEYDGDSEPTPHQTSLQRHAPMRATVDGDARRNRRHSSDESVGGGSVTELDHSEYLRRYQQSTPMQPGQRMGEYDIFASPRDPENPDRPFRPSLQEYQWTNKPGRKTSHV